MPLKQYDSEGNYVDTIYTQAELDKAVQAEREGIIEQGGSYCTYITPSDMCNGNTLRAYQKGVTNFVRYIRARSKS